MTRLLLALTLVAIAALTWTVSAQSRRFFPDDPIWREPVTQYVKNAKRYEPDPAAPRRSPGCLRSSPGSPTLSPADPPSASE